MKNISSALFVLITFLTLNCHSQEIKYAYVLEIRENKVYLDLKSGDVNIGNKLQIVREGGFFIHPVTGEKIKEDDEVIAILEIIDARSNYSIASIYPSEAIFKIEKGTKAILSQSDVDNQPILKKSIAIQPLTVSNIQGYLGIYIGDVLTEQLLKNDMFRVLDRQSLGLQADQIVLSSGGVLTETELLKYSSSKGADFYITGTMYEPDVVELSSGIPIKNIVKIAGYAAEAAIGKDLRVDRIAEFVPERTEIKRLKAVVRISLRVVDVKTGEIKFMCTEMQQAEGEGDINIEGGLLGGLKIRGGVTSFQNTITGKATQYALENLTKYILDYFSGKITERTFTGNIIEIKELNERVKSDKQRDLLKYVTFAELIKQPADQNKLNDELLLNDTLYFVKMNKGLDFKIKPKSYLKVFSPSFGSSQITGEESIIKDERIGHVDIISSFKDKSEGRLVFKEGFIPSSFNPDQSYAKVKKVWTSIYTLSKINIGSGEERMIYYPSIGFMIFGSFGLYGSIGVGEWHRNDRNEGYLGVGVLKSLNERTNLGIGCTLAVTFSFDITIHSRIGNNLNLIYGSSIIPGWNPNFAIPLGIGFCF